MMNYMIYFRGHSGDYDEWEQMGNSGWGWKDVQPHFKAIERFIGRDEEGVYGNSGRLAVEKRRHSYPIEDHIYEALREMGYKIGDVNGKLEDEGFFDTTAVALDHGWRAGTYKSFVEPILALTDIEVLTYSLAKQVILDGTTAKGVKVERFGQELVYHAKNEVIVSAGSIGSAQLLMLSGIGPTEELEKHGIPQVKELPVGQNLQDHCLVMGQFELDADDSMLMDPLYTMYPSNYIQYYTNSSGPFASNNLGLNGIIHTKAVKKTDRPGTFAFYNWD